MFVPLSQSESSKFEFKLSDWLRGTNALLCVQGGTNSKGFMSQLDIDSLGQFDDFWGRKLRFLPPKRVKLVQNIFWGPKIVKNRRFSLPKIVKLPWRFFMPTFYYLRLYFSVRIFCSQILFSFCLVNNNNLTCMQNANCTFDKKYSNNL